ncbi:MAG: hypothetical protein LBV27_04455 [Oscillospiraceae bacterium]|jgi:hypothetical protein|nr:hypothetical protein [Oscillospiraceae bacterium]
MINKNGAFASAGLSALLEKSSNAQNYFSDLPEYVQEMISQRGESIQSEDELYRYAENILQGDK